MAIYRRVDIPVQDAQDKKAHFQESSRPSKTLIFQFQCVYIQRISKLVNLELFYTLLENQMIRRKTTRINL